MKKIIKSISIEPSIWNLAMEQAGRKNRSISNYIEYLIVKDECEEIFDNLKKVYNEACKKGKDNDKKGTRK